MKAAAAPLIAGGAGIGVIAILRGFDAVGQGVPFGEWFWEGRFYGQPVSALLIVGGIMLGVGLSLARSR